MLASSGTSIAVAEGRQLRLVGQRLGEHHVGPGVDVGAGPLDRRVEALDGTGVGTGAHHEVGVAPGRDRSPDPPHHLLGGHDRLAVEVAAALGVDLVLEVAAGQAAGLERLDGTGDVHRLAEAGVGVDDGRQVGDGGDLATATGDLVQRGEPDVRQGKVGRKRGA